MAQGFKAIGWHVNFLCVQKNTQKFKEQDSESTSDAQTGSCVELTRLDQRQTSGEGQKICVSWKPNKSWLNNFNPCSDWSLQTKRPINLHKVCECFISVSLSYSSATLIFQMKHGSEQDLYVRSYKPLLKFICFKKKKFKD